MKKPVRNRKLTRLKGYDYSQCGFYFVTVSIKDHICVFGDICKTKMVLNKIGEIVQHQWQDLPNHYNNCILHSFVVMPNHVHGIIQIDNERLIDKHEHGNDCSSTFQTEKDKINKHGLSEMIRSFKSFSSRRINKIADFRFQWQKSFYDHIIRNDESFYKISEYIINNPGKWAEDRFYFE